MTWLAVRSTEMVVHLATHALIDADAVLADARLVAPMWAGSLHVHSSCALIRGSDADRVRSLRSLKALRRAARNPAVDGCHVCGLSRDVRSRFEPHADVDEPWLAEFHEVLPVVAWSTLAGLVLDKAFATRRGYRGALDGARAVLLASYALLADPAAAPAGPVHDLRELVAAQYQLLEAAHHKLARRTTAFDRDPERVWIAFGGDLLGESQRRRPHLPAAPLLRALSDSGHVPVLAHVAGTPVLLAQVRTTRFAELDATTGPGEAWATLAATEHVDGHDLAAALELLECVPGANPLRRFPVLDASEASALAAALTASKL